MIGIFWIWVYFNDHTWWLYKFLGVPWVKAIEKNSLSLCTSQQYLLSHNVVYQICCPSSIQIYHYYVSSNFRLNNIYVQQFKSKYQDREMIRRDYTFYSREHGIEIFDRTLWYNLFCHEIQQESLINCIFPFIIVNKLSESSLQWIQTECHVWGFPEVLQETCPGYTSLRGWLEKTTPSASTCSWSCFIPDLRGSPTTWDWQVLI